MDSDNGSPYSPGLQVEIEYYLPDAKKRVGRDYFVDHMDWQPARAGDQSARGQDQISPGSGENGGIGEREDLGHAHSGI